MCTLVPSWRLVRQVEDREREEQEDKMETVVGEGLLSGEEGKAGDPMVNDPRVGGGVREVEEGVVRAGW